MYLFDCMFFWCGYVEEGKRGRHEAVAGRGLTRKGRRERRESRVASSRGTWSDF
jgi:hypothetical protein